MAYVPKPALDDITDVDATGIVDGQTIVYSAGTYVPGTAGGEETEEVYVGPTQPTGLEDIWIDTDEPDPVTTPGGPVRYVHDQVVPAKVWTVPHSLGCHPAVTVEDGGGSIVVGSVTYIDNNSLTVGFAFTLTGRVNCV